MSSTQIIIDRLTKLENDNALLKSQLRAIKNKPEVKPVDNAPLFSAHSVRIEAVNESIKHLATLKELGDLKGRITKLESALTDCKKENKTITERYRADVRKLTDNVNNITIPKQHDHKSINDKIALLSIDINKLKSVKKPSQLSEKEIIKLICDKIPKEDKNKITVELVTELIKKTITVDYINRQYGK